MFAYAFRVVSREWFEKIGDEEDFENIYDLFSLILSRCVTCQIKKGLWKEYLSNEEESSLIRGKINFANTIKQSTQLKRKIICNFDDFSINSYMNQIIKSTICILLKKEVFVNLEYARLNVRTSFIIAYRLTIKSYINNYQAGYSI